MLPLPFRNARKPTAVVVAVAAVPAESVEPDTVNGKQVSSVPLLANEMTIEPDANSIGGAPPPPPAGVDSLPSVGVVPLTVIARMAQVVPE